MTRQRPPDHLPSDVIGREDFAEACANRDLGEVLRLSKKWGGPGFTASHLARRCELTVSRVQDYITGRVRAQNADVFTRVADGLHIPGHMFHLAPRPWEQSAVSTTSDHGILGEAVERPEDVSLSYSDLARLGAGFGTGTAAGYQSWPVRLTTTAQLDDVLEHLREQWHQLVKTDNLLGPRFAVRGVLDQLQTIENMLVYAGDSGRRRIVQLGAQYAESVSWLYEDGGDSSAAQYWISRAMMWAREADDPLMLSWIFFRLSQQAAASYNAAQVLRLTQAARRTRHTLPPPMRAAIAQQEAQGYALDGNELAAQHKFDEAHEFARKDNSGDARGGHGSFCTPGYIELQRAGCWLTLDEPERAIQIYGAALPDLPAVYRRDRGKALGRLAKAYIAVGALEQAAQTATEALHIAQSSGSTHTVDQVRTVGEQLWLHRTLPQVDYLLDQLTLGQLS